jgi:hypothetical protein
MPDNQKTPFMPIREGLEKGGSNSQQPRARPATPPGATKPQNPLTPQAPANGATTNQTGKPS